MLTEYWLKEDPQLVSHSMLENFSDQIASLRDDLARLEKRIERLI